MSPTARVTASSPAASLRMVANRGKDTTPELRLRSLLYAAGLRFRVDCRPVAGLRTRADAVIRRLHLAIFVDGCFWHACPKHGSLPKLNRRFWMQKFLANRRRDAAANRRLRALGWRVIRVWEHESMERAVKRILKQAGAQYEQNGPKPTTQDVQ